VKYRMSWVCGVDEDVDVGHGYVEDDRRSKTRKSCKCLVRYIKYLAFEMP
jgi:hypothetical protein